MAAGARVTVSGLWFDITETEENGMTTKRKTNHRRAAALVAVAVIAGTLALATPARASQPQVQEHCQLIWMTRQCFIVIQPYTVHKMGEFLDHYSTTQAALASGAIGVACLFLVHPVAIGLCMLAAAARAAHTVDQIRHAARNLHCLEVQYMPLALFNVPLGVSSKKRDGGWCAGEYSSGRSGFAGGEAGGGGGGGGGGSW